MDVVLVDRGQLQQLFQQLLAGTPVVILQGQQSGWVKHRRLLWKIPGQLQIQSARLVQALAGNQHLRQCQACLLCCRIFFRKSLEKIDRLRRCTPFQQLGLEDSGGFPARLQAQGSARFIQSPLLIAGGKRTLRQGEMRLRQTQIRRQNLVKQPQHRRLFRDPDKHAVQMQQAAGESLRIGSVVARQLCRQQFGQSIQLPGLNQERDLDTARLHRIGFDCLPLPHQLQRQRIVAGIAGNFRRAGDHFGITGALRQIDPGLQG